MTILDYLLNQKFVSPEQVQKAKGLKEGSSSVIRSLLELNFLCESSYHEAVLANKSISFIDLDQIEIDEDLWQDIPQHLLERYCVVPFEKENDNALKVAMVDPFDLVAIDDLRSLTSLNIRPYLSSREKILKKITSCDKEDRKDDLLRNIETLSKDKVDWDDENLKSNHVILTLDRSPIVQLVDHIIIEAINCGASDLHLQPCETHIDVRYRVDGLLRTQMSVPSNLKRHLSSRIKIMAQLDIAESRRPQDGRIFFKAFEKAVDLRVSIMPTAFGEKIVMRLLNKKAMQVPFEKIGFKPKDLLAFQEIIRHPQGMVLVCGPTGSGKTTTVYAALNEINTKERNIISIEDPIEYTINGINQVCVNDKVGLTFANCLRSVLRQDPDTVFIGEIRDQETAEIAFRSAMTGHLVFSTLHTNTAFSTIIRLRDIGIESFLISSPLIGILSQCLLRVNCPHCATPYEPPKDLMLRFKGLIDAYPEKVFLKGKGCEHCHYFGYKGRVAIFEIASFDQPLRDMINKNASEKEMIQYAQTRGFRTLIEEAIEKAVTGVTSLEEVRTVIGARDYKKEERLSDAASPEISSSKEKLLDDVLPLFERFMTSN